MLDTNCHLSQEEPYWFVMNAYAKSEHKAEEALSGKDGLPYFIPKRYVIRTYNGQSQRKLVPLIPNIVFVHATYNEVNEFQKLHPFLGFATTRRDGAYRIMKVPNREMEEFMEVARHYDADLTYYRPEEIELDKGTRIRIIGGTFDGAQGILVRIKGKRGKRLVVQIPELMAIATTYIEPEFIQILPNQ